MWLDVCVFWLLWVFFLLALLKIYELLSVTDLDNKVLLSSLSCK